MRETDADRPTRGRSSAGARSPQRVRPHQTSAVRRRRFPLTCPTELLLFIGAFHGHSFAFGKRGCAARRSVFPPARGVCVRACVWPEPRGARLQSSVVLVDSRFGTCIFVEGGLLCPGGWRRAVAACGGGAPGSGTGLAAVRAEQLSRRAAPRILC